MNVSKLAAVCTIDLLAVLMPGGNPRSEDVRARQLCLFGHLARAEPLTDYRLRTCSALTHQGAAPRPPFWGMHVMVTRHVGTRGIQETEVPQ